MAKVRTVHVCAECGTPHPKWVGQCAGCGAWNSLEEEPVVAAAIAAPPVRPDVAPVEIGAVDTAIGRPQPTGLAELDRVLGGGLVRGSVTLLGGEPGIGKSTLLLQLAAWWPGRTLYVSAEESAHQVRERADRLRAVRPDLWLLSETSLPHVLGAVEELAPDLVVVDSIQTIADPQLGSTPGTVAQVRGCAHRLVTEAKQRDVPVIIVGHVTKDGGLAGPRVLEHVVDTVLAFEGDRHHALRLLRASKHRFGPTSELGLFEMTSTGLQGVPDPSRLFLADRRQGLPGSAVAPTVEGQRPIVVEVQALTSTAPPGAPLRRTSQGIDGNRLALLLAVLHERTGLHLGDRDVYASTVGGVKLAEPGLDLAVCLAVASSVTSRPLPPDVAAFGEVGLGGELRQVGHAARRLGEVRRLGFRRAIVPANTSPDHSGLHVVRASTLAEALDELGLHSPASRRR
jgi:DNA repair protein RadA/Sms